MAHHQREHCRHLGISEGVGISEGDEKEKEEEMSFTETFQI